MEALIMGCQKKSEMNKSQPLDGDMETHEANRVFFLKENISQGLNLEQFKSMLNRVFVKRKHISVLKLGHYHLDL
jgi:hypothetical protein